MFSHLAGLKDTIVAIATPPGIGALGIIRVSGEAAFDIVQKIYPQKILAAQQPNTLHVGYLKDGDTFLDEVVLSLYRNPKSFTGEDVIEISCHGSPYILQQVLEVLLKHGARLARPGEFSQRAFLNQKMDLAQAEAIADIINAETKSAHDAAMNQMRGGFSKDLNSLRDRLIHFTALLELELDFSDEDVEFADRRQLRDLVDEVYLKTTKLMNSFVLGNVIKKGVRVAIIGKPNSGKSTLLNALLNEERAIVSDIAGTTRDTIEETVNINGILFRLIDTAGIREHTIDRIEHMGIERSKKNAAEADIILHVIDLTQKVGESRWMNEYKNKIIVVYNKSDQSAKFFQHTNTISDSNTQTISAKRGEGIEVLRQKLYDKAVGSHVYESSIVTNTRHYEALSKVRESIESIQKGLVDNLTGDLLTVDVRRALYYLGEITGQVEIDRDILGTIFGKFCIGK